MVTRGKASDLDLAYLAGIVDGEGSVGLDKMGTQNQRWVNIRFHPQVTVVNANMDLMVWLSASFGGTFRPRQQQRPYHKQTWRWKLTGRAAADLCQDLLPFLRIKHAQA